MEIRFSRLLSQSIHCPKARLIFRTHLCDTRFVCPRNYQVCLAGKNPDSAEISESYKISSLARGMQARSVCLAGFTLNEIEFRDFSHGSRGSH